MTNGIDAHGKAPKKGKARRKAAKKPAPATGSKAATLTKRVSRRPAGS